MSIQDGFGDDLSIDEYIREHEGLLRLKVADRTRGNVNSNDTWDDLLQEGRIVEWTVLTKRPDAPAAYVSAAMSNRIGECLKRGTWTGMETHRGRARDPLRRRDRDSVDDETLQLDQVVDSSAWVEHALLGYHQGQILKALNELTFTQKTYVYERFWEGRTNREIAARRGLSVATVERQWRTDIRPALVEELELLAGM